MPSLIVSVTDFGTRPDSGEDAGPALQRAVVAAEQSPEGAVIRFAPGRYDVHSESAMRVDYNVTNTAPESVGTMKNIGLLLKNAKNVTIEGQGALLMMQGMMTPLVLDHCENITLKDLHIDFSRPSVSELRIVAKTDNTLDAEIHPDAKYVITDGTLYWVGEGLPRVAKESQEYDPELDKTWRTWNPVTSAKRAEEIRPGLVRFTYDNLPQVTVGHSFLMRDGVRSNVGALMTQCKNIVWENVGVHAMDGIGIVSQFSENLTFHKLDCSPRAETGRICDSAADFMQFSGCRGLVSVTDGNFSGAQDDAINVHGTHLQIEETPSPNRIVVRFMHPETWGLPAFQVGDVLDFVKPSTLTVYASGTVGRVERRDGREFLLTLNESAPPGIALHSDCVENATWTPDVLIQGCRFARVPTRGVLVTTRGKVRIEDNIFWRTPMSAILIADDARNWYESGMARDVLILGNRFFECASPVINIDPENADADAENPVHRNIRIVGNTFAMPAGRALNAKSTQGLTFTGNALTGPGWPGAQSIGGQISLDACTDVEIRDNATSASE